MTKKRAPGGGRKPLTPTEPTVKVAITLLSSQVEAMKQLGDGNLSAGIREAIDSVNNSSQNLSLGFDFARHIRKAQDLLFRAQGALTTHRREWAARDATECRELIAWIRQHPISSDPQQRETDEIDLDILAEIEQELNGLSL